MRSCVTIGRAYHGNRALAAMVAQLLYQRRHGMRRRRTACTIRTELTMFAEMRIVSGPVAQAAERAFLFAVTTFRRSFPDDSRASL